MTSLNIKIPLLTMLSIPIGALYCLAQIYCKGGWGVFKSGRGLGSFRARRAEPLEAWGAG